MRKTIKAKFADGVLTPLEPLELTEDEVVLITLDVKEKVGEWQKPDRMPRTPEEVREAEAAAMKMIRELYTLRHRGLNCDCIYCAPETEEVTE